MRGKEITACLGCLFLVSVFVIVMEIDISFVSKDRSERRMIRDEIITDHTDGDGVVKIDPDAQLPYEGRKTGEIETTREGRMSKVAELICCNVLLVAL